MGEACASDPDRRRQRRQRSGQNEPRSKPNSGGIDILVNNAGILKIGTVLDSSYEDWDQVCRVNLSGVYYCCKAVLPAMLKKRSGKIINIASISAFKGGGVFGNVLYGTTKAGVAAHHQGPCPRGRSSRHQCQRHSSGACRYRHDEPALERKQSCTDVRSNPARTSGLDRRYRQARGLPGVECVGIHYRRDDHDRWRPDDKIMRT